MNEQPKIKSNLEYLRKLFIMPDSPDKFVEFGDELLKMIHEFFQEKGGIHSSISLPELSKMFNQKTLPHEPHLIQDVLTEIKTKIIAHSVKVGNPYYIGHMISAVPYFMILLEMIIAALNQNQVKIETAKASSFVERELVAWLHRLVFNRTDLFYEKNIQNHRIALGNVTSDGSLANVTALLVAREKAFPADADFPGFRMAGMHRALQHYGYDRGVIMVSTRGHYSIKKAVNLLGLGEENVITIPVDEKNRINIRKLRRKIDFLAENGSEKTKIVAIVGIAGTTETGNVDDLDALGKIAREAGAYFHVDACWGGSALLADDYRYLFKGISKADSVSIDAHKLLYCPMSMGLILFRNEKDLNTIRHSSKYIIRRNSVDMGRFTVEGSRPFAALKPWASLKIIGREGYGILMKQAKTATENLLHMIRHCGNFEALNDPDLFILTYRFLPEPLKNQIASLEETASLKRGEERKEFEQKIRKINFLVNGLNIKLHKALRRDDTTFVSRTTLESTRYRPQNIVVLRAVLMNPLINKRVLEEIVDTQNRIGSNIWKEFEPAYLKMVN
ncbi:MAG: glutamate decarboxylase [Desulfobacteraceae bacterium 4572_87]|nr:MAG: glutamate decarboxylase [Desulfobacteraceae bacterium 4572_87]